MKTRSAFLVFLCAAVFFSTSSYASNVLVIPKVTAPKTIDGSPADWGSNWSTLTETYSGSTTFNTKAKFQIAYDDTYLYYISTATDATPHNEDALATYQQDCMLLYVSTIIPNRTGILSEKTTWRVLRVQDASPAAGFTRSGLSTTDAYAKSISTPEGYTTELKVAWSVIASSDGVTGFNINNVDTLRIEMEVCDNTDGTTGSGATGRTQRQLFSGYTDNQQGARTTYYGYAMLDRLTIAKRASPPTIDAGISDWGPDWIAISNQDALGTTVATKGRFQIAYDDNRLYVIAATNDATPHNETTISSDNRDCIDLFVSLNTATTTGLAGKTRYRLQRTGSPVEDGSVGVNAVSVINTNLNHVWPNWKPGYTQEWSIPWSGLASREGYVGGDINAFKFELRVADNTDGLDASGATGRTQQTYWGSNAGDLYNSSQDYTIVNLSSPLTSIGTVTAANTPVSSLTLSPSSKLTVSGSGSLNIDQNKTLSSVTLNGGAQLTVASGQTLTLTNLTLKSDASGTSTYKPEGTGALVVTGTTAVEQYLATTRNWYVSSPVNNAVAPVGYTYYRRDESLSGDGWIPVSAGADLAPGVGYTALPGTAELPITFTTQTGGSLNDGPIPVDLTYTSSATSGKGFNLIGNPYPSHLNWTKAFTDANAAKIEPTIWYRSKVGNGNTGGWSFKTYNAFSGYAVPASTTGMIAPMQGFWVLAKQTTSIEFTNSMRSQETGNPLKAPAAKNARNVDGKVIRLQVSNGTTNDETLLVFDANASDGYDSYDSPKMMNNATDMADIYTVADGKKLVINGMSSLRSNTEIPLGFSTLAAGDFSISASELSNLEAGTRLMLIDKNYPSAETELTPETAYHFSAPKTAATTDRFSLLFRGPGAVTELKDTEKLHAQVVVNAANQISIIAPEKSHYAIYNAVGQKVNESMTTSTHTTANVKLSSGIYIVRVSENGKELTTKVIIN